MTLLYWTFVCLLFVSLTLNIVLFGQYWILHHVNVHSWLSIKNSIFSLSLLHTTHTHTHTHTHTFIYAFTCILPSTTTWLEGLTLKKGPSPGVGKPCKTTSHHCSNSQISQSPLYIFFIVLPCPLWQIQVTLPARAALPIPASVCRIFVCPNNGMAASVWDFWRAHRCWCMQLHTEAVQMLWKSPHWKLTPG